MSEPVTAAGWLQGLRALHGGVASTNLQRDPDDPYDPDDDVAWTWRVAPTSE